MSTPPTLADLLPSLYSDYVDRWSHSRMERLRAVLETASARPTEPMVTDLLAAADCQLGDDLIRIFLDATGRRDQATDELTLVTGANFKRVYPGPCQHVPDLLVCDKNTLRPVVIIEGKLYAWVNGKGGYCAQRPNAYSNQVMSYVDGCWTSEPLDQASFLWVGPSAYLKHESGPWGPKALGPRDHLTYDGVDDQAWARQEAARERWLPLSWEDLRSSLGSEPSSRALSRIIEVWTAL